MSFARPRKSVLALASASTTNGATATALIDTLGGFGLCKISVNMTTADSTTNVVTTLKLSESDDTVVTNFTDITAFVAGGTGGFTKPAPSTSTNQPNLYQFNVDLRGRKRYLKVTATPPTTQTITIWAELEKASKAPQVASEGGAIAIVEG